MGQRSGTHHLTPARIDGRRLGQPIASQRLDCAMAGPKPFSRAHAMPISPSEVLSARLKRRGDPATAARTNLPA
jgi:hypothetical protein